MSLRTKWPIDACAACVITRVPRLTYVKELSLKDNPYICTYSSVLLLICVSLVHNKRDGCRDPAHVAENEVAYRRLRSMCEHRRRVASFS